MVQEKSRGVVVAKVKYSDYVKRADEFYTKERVKDYSSYRQDYAKLTKSTRYKYIKKVLTNIKQKFNKKINVLDLGCGEGRYFHLFNNAKKILGVDASKEMLASAKKYHGKDKRIKLVRANLLTFETNEKFDIIISNGVLCEHSPLTMGLLNMVHNQLNMEGYFFFTTTVPGRIKLKLRRKIADIVLLTIKPFARKSWIYRKLLSSYKSPRKVRKMIERTDFKILSSKKVNNKGSHIDQTFWLLKK